MTEQTEDPDTESLQEEPQRMRSTIDWRSPQAEALYGKPGIAKRTTSFERMQIARRYEDQAASDRDMEREAAMTRKRR